MPAAFTLYGELVADTSAFERSLRQIETGLQATRNQIDQTEKGAKSMGNTSAVTARQFDKLKDSVQQQKQKLQEAAQAYQKGDLTARQYANSVASAGNNVDRLNSRLKDSQARLNDWASRANKAGSIFQSVFQGSLAAAGITNLGLAMKDAALEGAHLAANLDKLTRFTATLDKSFQTPEALKQFRDSIVRLSTEIPHTAESIAKASFTIKSAYQNMTQQEVINFLREFGKAATASNTDIATYTQNVAAMAKQYGITAENIKGFSAIISSSFGAALASDSEVAAGFNRILNSAKALGQPLTEVAAAMSTLQSLSGDAATNTTLLLNVYSKLTDKKYIQGLADIGVAVYDAEGNFRDLSLIITDLQKKLAGMSDKEINDALAFAKDQQARDGLKALTANADKFAAAVKQGADELANMDKQAVTLNSQAAKWQLLLNKIDAVKIGLGAAFVDFVSIDWKKELTMPDAAYTAALNHNRDRWHSMGVQLVAGFAAGIMAGDWSAVKNAASQLAMSAYIAGAQALMIRSPSKLFHSLGQDTVQGYVDGISSMTADAQAAIVKLVTPKAIKGELAKQLKELRDSLRGAMLSNDATAGGISQTMKFRIALEGAEDIKQKFEDLIKLRIRLGVNLDKPLVVKDVSRELMQLNDIDEALNNIKSTVKEFSDANSDPYVRLMQVFADPAAAIGLKKTATELGLTVTGMKTLAKIKGFQDFAKDRDKFGEGGPDLAERPIGTNLNGLTELEQQWEDIREESRITGEEMRRSLSPGPIIDYWQNFGEMFKRQMAGLQSTLPSFKQALGVNLINSIERVGDVFAQAVTQWDGTAKGFFTSIAKGFGDLIQEIISQLIRLMVIKAITSIASSVFGINLGGGGGGGGWSGDGQDFLQSIGTWAGGGMIRGPGSPTSDSIPAMLSNGEFVMNARAVRKFGVGFMERLNGMSMMTPPMAFAGGGLVGAGTSAHYDHSSRSQIVNVNMVVNAKDAASFNRSQSQITREISNQLKQQLFRE